MKEILGEAKTIRQLLSSAKYAIDYYQREYRWEYKQVIELIEDLTSKFKEDYEAKHSREKVQGYGHYFLGSIIISHKDSSKYIIDGQQRLTTLTLLLIHLNNLQSNSDDRVDICPLIFSSKYAKKSFNIDVEERTSCMEALFKNEEFDSNGCADSVKNILVRYSDIKEQFPSDLENEVLPYFIDWLIENVHLVEITAYSDEDAYTVFETMNDRGLSLTPTEMLKGYLLSNIEDGDKKTSCNNLWKKKVHGINEWGKDEDADFIKAWLRSQYAKTIRPRKKGASPGDYDRLGTEFHRWLRENHETIGLYKSDDYIDFIEKNFKLYSHYYLLIIAAEEELTEGLEYLYYNSVTGFTLQYPLLLSSVTLNDTEDIVKKKFQIISIYLDILLTWRQWNFRSVSYSTLQYAMFQIMKDIRHKSPEQIAKQLTKKLLKEDENFDTSDLSLHNQNKWIIHRILARITDYLEQESEQPSHFDEYINVTTKGKNRYEVEHIWANKYERHRKEFDQSKEFEEYRNKIGGLLLLPKSFNQSYGSSTYKKKIRHYNSQNLLVRSLHSDCYDHNPKFLRFLKESQLDFKPYEQFGKKELDERNELYREICKKIWNPGLLMSQLETND